MIPTRTNTGLGDACCACQSAAQVTGEGRCASGVAVQSSFPIGPVVRVSVKRSLCGLLVAVLGACQPSERFPEQVVPLADEEVGALIAALPDTKDFDRLSGAVADASCEWRFQPASAQGWSNGDVGASVWLTGQRCQDGRTARMLLHFGRSSEPITLESALVSIDHPSGDAGLTVVVDWHRRGRSVASGLQAFVRRVSRNVSGVAKSTPPEAPPDTPLMTTLTSVAATHRPSQALVSQVATDLSWVREAGAPAVVASLQEQCERWSPTERACATNAEAFFVALEALLADAQPSVAAQQQAARDTWYRFEDADQCAALGCRRLEIPCTSPLGSGLCTLWVHRPVVGLGALTERSVAQTTEEAVSEAGARSVDETSRPSTFRAPILGSVVVPGSDVPIRLTLDDWSQARWIDGAQRLGEPFVSPGWRGLTREQLHSASAESGEHAAVWLPLGAEASEVVLGATESTNPAVGGVQHGGFDEVIAAALSLLLQAFAWLIENWQWAMVLAAVVAMIEVAVRANFRSGAERGYESSLRWILKAAEIDEAELPEGDCRAEATVVFPLAAGEAIAAGRPASGPVYQGHGGPVCGPCPAAVAMAVYAADTEAKTKCLTGVVGRDTTVGQVVLLLGGPLPATHVCAQSKVTEWSANVPCGPTDQNVSDAWAKNLTHLLGGYPRVH